MGWMLVTFDLPVTTKEERKLASDFRKFLLEDGFQMIQYSVYLRSLVSHARMETHIRRLREHTPPDGAVRAIFITESQWQHSFVLYGKMHEHQTSEELPAQLQLW